MARALVILSTTLLLVTGIVLPLSAEVKLPQLQKGKGESCVEATDVMRRDHMKFLLHHRQEAVHEGIRTKKYSLVECIECHAVQGDGGDFIPVNAPEQFCQSCHAFAGVQMDCFECHGARPTQSSYFHPLVAPVTQTSQGNHRLVDSESIGPAPDHLQGFLRFPIQVSLLCGSQ